MIYKDKIKLICIPFAGGLASSYIKWKQYLSDFIELCPIELAGRGRYFGEPLYENILEAVEDITNKILPIIQNKKSKYVLFGHSMGSILAYELGHKIMTKDYSQPQHIIFSGSNLFEENNAKFSISSNDEDFEHEILKLGATPRQIFDDASLKEIFMPIIRADCKIIEQYKLNFYEDKYSYDISVFNGKEDLRISTQDTVKWKNITNKNCDFYTFSGGHFFIFDYIEETVNILNNIISCL